MAALPVLSPSDLPLDTFFDGTKYATGVATAFVNKPFPVPASRVTVTVGPAADGAAAPTNPGIYLVLSPLNDADGKGKIAQGPAACPVVHVGSSQTFNFDDASLCTGIAYQGMSSSVEANGLVVSITVGFKA